MSGYNGRKGPNVSRFIANLNTIPNAQDLALPQDTYLEDDVLSFMNTDFIDWDLGTGDALPPVDYDPTAEQQVKRQNTTAFENNSRPEFINNDFQFPDFSTFQPVADASLTAVPSVQTPPFPFSTQSPTAISPPTADASTGAKRKFDDLTSPAADGPIEESSRLAAEEDKRRRNTAASARFRVKKKQREQALEKTAKEMTDKVGSLEAKVGQLELENKWLKSLITEKNDGVPQGDMKELFEKFAREERSKSERKDGVGTAGKV